MVPLNPPSASSLGAVSAANDVLIRIRRNSGLIGFRAGLPFPPITGKTQDTNLSMARSLRKMFIGKDPLAIESLVAEMGAVVHSNPASSPPTTRPCSISSTAAGLPVFRLLGGTRAVFETDVTKRAIDTPAGMAANAREHAGRG